MRYPLFTTDYLAHHGIKGQRWGVRRFQYEDGSLTSAGRDRYGATGSGGHSTTHTPWDEKPPRDYDIKNRIDNKVNQRYEELQRYKKQQKYDSIKRDIKDVTAKTTAEAREKSVADYTKARP